MIALIDADSIIYIIAWHHKDLEEIAADVVTRSCDSIVSAILRTSKADKYLGSFSGDTCFRDTHYKYATYKGQRKEKADYVQRWEPIIRAHLQDKWGFIIPTENVEADDIITGLWYILNDPLDIMICSPDKDLKQIPGYHLDYRKLDNGCLYLQEDTATINFWTQMLTGDGTDNVAGIPGLGPVKVDKLFKDLGDLSDFSLMQLVKDQYTKYFGGFYGPIIYRETLITIQLLQPTHILWSEYNDILALLVKNIRETPALEEGLEATMLGELGW